MSAYFFHIAGHEHHGTHACTYACASGYISGFLIGARLRKRRHKRLARVTRDIAKGHACADPMQQGGECEPNTARAAGEDYDFASEAGEGVWAGNELRHGTLLFFDL